MGPYSQFTILFAVAPSSTQVTSVIQISRIAAKHIADDSRDSRDIESGDTRVESSILQEVQKALNIRSVQALD